MDRMDDLRAELKAMEKIAKILHELPSSDSLVRVAAWVQEVTRPDMTPETEAPAVVPVVVSSAVSADLGDVPPDNVVGQMLATSQGLVPPSGRQPVVAHCPPAGRPACETDANPYADQRPRGRI